MDCVEFLVLKLLVCELLELMWDEEWKQGGGGGYL